MKKTLKEIAGELTALVGIALMAAAVSFGCVAGAKLACHVLW